MQGLVVESKSTDSWYPTKMLASTGPSGQPIAMPSVCLYMVLLKLNYTENVAVFISLIKMFLGKSGKMSLPL